MANKDITASATGIDETKAYLQGIQDFNVAAAEQETAMRLLPSVRRFTRVLSGQLQAGWDANEGSFINTVQWAIPQEYGSKYVDPMHSIESAFITGERTVQEVFENAVNEKIKA